ncbi:unnamed protein product [Acanthosepion pharaonis]|uniref:Uncharacterized protein n=1 Tax=Acanthosepion pharaonis TaxID=158019 RepID=A0A812DY42_ACAPH|nr:unnamed protein product [Sepia pharaonis]
MPKSSSDSNSTDEKNINNKEKMPKKHSRMSTIPMVNRQAVEILEEFLKKHQESLKDITPMNSLYQKVSELEVNEEKPNLRRNQSYRAASHESLLSNENESFQNTLFEEELNTYTAPLASDEASDSTVESPVSAPEATYYKRKSSADSSSSDSSEWASEKRHKKSFFKRARERLKSLHRSGRKSLSLGRKDKDVELAQKQIYRRSYSDSNEKCIHVTKEESKEDEKSLTTKVFNEVISMEGGSEDFCCQVGSAKERKHLHLNINPVFAKELPATGNFDFESEHYETVTTIKTPDGQTHRDRVIEHHEHLTDQLETDQSDEIVMEGDQVDGAVGGAIEDDSEQNKMALYKRVASKLAIMADEYIQSDSEGACSASEIPVPDTSELTELEKEIVDHLLSIQGNTPFPSVAAMEILKQLTYNNFKQIVEAYTKNKNGFQEVVTLFMLSKAAISLVGAGRALASQVKDLTLQYFEDKCAAYIVERGGWDSVLEDTDEDTENKDSEQK